MRRSSLNKKPHKRKDVQTDPMPHELPTTASKGMPVDGPELPVPVSVPLQVNLDDPRASIFSQGGPLGAFGDQFGATPLECLQFIDCIYLEQAPDIRQCCDRCCIAPSKFKVFDCHGRMLFHAEEDACCCARACCGQRRSFEMAIRNRHDKEIIHITRNFNCGSCFFCVCLDSIDVFCPPGNFVGQVQKQFSLMGSKYNVMDGNGEVVFNIFGPCCTKTCCCCCTNTSFDIHNEDGEHKGRISKQYPAYFAQDGGLDQSSNYGVSFPHDLHEEMKAVLLASCILIEVSFPEKNRSMDASNNYSTDYRNNRMNSNNKNNEFPPNS